ncbi:BON domain-containing protein [Nesterenkonia sandarakina]|uniref:Osmotically-inducible protein OsmY n=1 Tax=Nesterenkonia sandarakina TaxID=272918 RepID=A0A7Z0E6K5_9MICC|nr:BON domain-containing protein [Nesterenkonia sandarakina]NYJ15993.1 osmotically-inducible protein OsmY [Nesterenkonia sandarakina]
MATAPPHQTDAPRATLTAPAPPKATHELCSPGAVRRSVENALHHTRNQPTHLVIVTIVENTVVLRGRVKSRAEKKRAGLAAWASPDVLRVDNRLQIRHF